jgi:hypothetical protein
MDKDRKPIVLLAVLAASAILLSAVIAVDADAARGSGRGGGKGGKGGGSTTAVCSAAPNPVAQGEVVTISASGFAPFASVGYTISSSSGTGGGFVTADSSGGFSFSGAVSWLGTNTVTASGGGATATCAFEVV